jgi:hypothetical protein
MGSEAGEAHDAVMVEPGETIWTGDGRFNRTARTLPGRSSVPLFLCG